MSNLLLFVHAGLRAPQAAQAFVQAAGLFRGQFKVETRTPVMLSEADIAAARRIVVFRTEDVIVSHVGKFSVWATGEDSTNSTQLLAVLLGGGAVYTPTTKTDRPAKPKALGTVKLSRETAGRRGKGVTVVSDLPMNEERVKELATVLKSKCGSGGTAKDGRIEIQGDHRDTIQTYLEAQGYKVKRSGG